jgi:ATP adenylyltransferase/5',5'''-P-1,P-4-tetraphosphate phosphorylase II
LPAKERTKGFCKYLTLALTAAKVRCRGYLSTTNMSNQFDISTISGTFSDCASELLAQQKLEWISLRDNYNALRDVKVRDFDFDNFKIRVQFNPARIVSSAAKVDPKSIAERRCFLCINNLPEVQKGIPFTKEYMVLCNPFPIFPKHLTIPKLAHEPQQILPHFGSMLSLAQSLDGFTIFYNGPKCGASAPDHFHYQAGNKGFLPIEHEFDSLLLHKGETLYQSAHLSINAVGDYLRNFISLESDSKEELIKAFNLIYSILQKQNTEGGEPMLNILAMSYGTNWRVIIFPRGKHRPSQFFAEGDDNILISPASVDFGGVLITPQEKDFQKITKKDIISIFGQCSISEDKFDSIKKEVKLKL